MAEHEHDWQLADYVRYSEIGGDERAIFICVCGTRKRVEVKHIEYGE